MTTPAPVVLGDASLQRLLLGPGPSEVPPRVPAALAAPTLGHLDPEYLRIMDETSGLLETLLREGGVRLSPGAALEAAAACYASSDT